MYGHRFDDIGDWNAVEIFQFPYGRSRFSLRRSDRLHNINVWLPMNYEDLFVGAIDRIDNRIPIVRVLGLQERNLDNGDRILQAALAAYDHHLSVQQS